MTGSEDHNWGMIFSGINTLCTCIYMVLTYCLLKAANSQAESGRKMLVALAQQSQTAIKLAQLSADAVISSSLAIHFQKLEGSDHKFTLAKEAIASGMTIEAVKNGYVLGAIPPAIVKGKNLQEGLAKLEEAIKSGLDQKALNDKKQNLSK